MTFADDANDLGNIFTDVRMKLGVDEAAVEIPSGSEIEITDGMNLRLEFDWVLKDATKIVDGKWSKIILPDKFKLINDKIGNIIAADKTTILGTYHLTKADNTLKILLNDVLDNKEGRTGDVWVDFEFDLDKFIENTSQEVQFATNPVKDFTIKLKPKKGAIINKTGQADKDLNASKITWTLDINTSLENIKNATITDTLPTGLQLDTIEVYPLTVGYNGKLTPGTKVKDETTFPLVLGDIDTAYRIIYKTTIIDKSKVDFTNNANIIGDGVNESDLDKVDTPSGSLIEKSDGLPNKDGANSENISWKIQVNLSESTIEGAKVKDTIGPALVLKEDSVKIYNLTVNTDGTTTRGGQLTGPAITYTKPDLLIDLGDINTAYEIEYITDIDYGSAESDYSKSYTFDNKAELTGTKDSILDTSLGLATSSAIVSRGAIAYKEGAGNIKPGSKTIDWTIKVNEAEDTIFDVWVEDKSGTGIEYISGSAIVKDKAGNLVDPTTYTINVPGDGGDDFKLIFPGKMTSTYTVEYSTKITDFTMTKFDNAARVSWIPRKPGTGLGVGGSGTAEISPGGESDRIYKDIKIGGFEAPVENKYNKSKGPINYKQL